MSPRDVFNKLLGRLESRPTAPRTARASRDRSEAGDTLIEVLLALIVLALASVALIVAFSTDISASAEHRSLANFDTALASSIATTTSLIQGQYFGVFSTCPNPADPLSGYPSEAQMTSALGIAGYTATIEPSGTLPSVEYTDGSTFTSACDSANVGGPQLITLVVTDTATGRSQTNSVVVVDPIPIQVSGGGGAGATITLLFETNPEGATVDSPFTTQPIIEVVNSSTGQIVTTDLSPITLTLSGGPGGATLSPDCSGVETSGVVVYSGCSINEVGNGYVLTATVASPTNPGQLLYGQSTDFSVFSAQLDTPTITAVTPSTDTAGAINVTFAGSTNAPSGQTYTIKACTDPTMTDNCTTPTTFTSGSDLTGLVQGTSYWVQITAAASGNYLAATSPPFGPTMATVQLAAPTGVTLGYGPTAGSLFVGFTPPGIIAAGQTYTIEACPNSAMSNKQGTCVSNATFTGPGNLTGLTIVPGSPGTLYYVQVSANASPGYLASPASAGSPPPSYAAMSQVKTPTGFSAASSASQVGAITASFSESGTGVEPSSFTATACTDQLMIANCVTAINYIAGTPLIGLIPGTGYYVQITAVSTTPGYASAMTGLSALTVATEQLAAPTLVTANYGTVAGSISVTFTAPLGAPGGQTYTVQACANVTMAPPCSANTNYPQNANLTGLSYTPGSPGVTYYVEVTANASSGYLASPASTQASHADESQIGPPSTPKVAPSTTTAGAVVATFNAPSGPAPFSYNATACLIGGNGCVTVNNYVSGVTQLSGLTQGDSYDVQITAVAPTGFVNNTSGESPFVAATLQLPAPRVTLNYGATAGSMSLTLAEPGAPAGQTYTVAACTNPNMTGCIAPVSNFTSGASLSGLAATPGNTATTYYVEVAANASSGYLASSASAQANHADTGQVNATGTPTAVTSTRRGAIVVSFVAASGNAPSNYSVQACPNQNMTGTCVTANNFTSGGQLGGLMRGGYYWVQITNEPAGYIDAVSAVSTTDTEARP
ncbi:MAG: hypothetical protein ACRDVC_02125 [Acidimicrobiales bacterium]